jgi:hypothetical protein
MRILSVVVLAGGLTLSLNAFPQNAGQTSTTEKTTVKTKHKKHKNSTTTTTTTKTKDNPK